MRIVKPEVKFLTPLNGEQILLDIQRVAKTCYKTYSDKDDVESAKRIVKRLIDSKHEAMLEFADITVNFIGNVAMYKDLTRHRHGSFAIESTRYCNYTKDKFDGEIRFLDPVEIPDKKSEQYRIWKQIMSDIEYSYGQLAVLGAKPDTLSLLLPHSTAAEFNIRANLREWRHILSLRSSIAATGHARDCIADVMDKVLEEFHKKIPVVFDDLYEQLQLKRKEKAEYNLKVKQALLSGTRQKS